MITKVYLVIEVTASPDAQGSRVRLAACKLSRRAADDAARLLPGTFVLLVCADKSPDLWVHLRPYRTPPAPPIPLDLPSEAQGQT